MNYTKCGVNNVANVSDHLLVHCTLKEKEKPITRNNYKISQL